MLVVEPLGTQAVPLQIFSIGGDTLVSTHS